MKKNSFVKMLAAAFALVFFSACSKQQYNFAPGTGAYHGETNKMPAAVSAQSAPETAAYATTTEPAIEAVVSAPQEAASALALAVEGMPQGTALAQNLNLKAEPATPEKATETSGKTNKFSLKQLKKEMKQLKKDIKDGKGEQGLGLNNNVKLLLILGLAFILVGALLHVGIIYTIGAILLIIGLVLFLMEIL